MKTYKISIAKPCSENWDNMTPAEKGKHCAACNKVVIDFSNMSQQEMMHILVKYKGKKVCGNFYNTQIEKPINYISIKRHAKWPAITAMLIAGMFQLMPINGGAQKESTIYPYSSIMLTVKGDSPKNVNTEPGKDSLITYTIKVSSREDKIAVVGATVVIENIGTYTSDINGVISFSITKDKIPDLVHVDLSAHGFGNESITIQKNKIIKSKNIELWLIKKETYMIRGDVGIEDSH